jgi:excisionase family DNA binding protein
VSTSAAQASRWLSPPEIAELLGIDDAKVVAWIRAGELKASNVAAKAAGKRARWRISQLSLDEFLARREAVPTIKPIRKRRQRSDDVIPFF